MNTDPLLTTSRLSLQPLTSQHGEFILQLVNTDGWLKFIGNRNVNAVGDAVNYIQRIINNPDIQYWVAHLAAENTPIGIVTFIKRDYLAHHDIGFAFLPAFSKNGYAAEAAQAVLERKLQTGEHTHILATTISQNINSIKLLQKLGLAFEKEIQVKQEKLQVYSASVDQLKIDIVTRSFFTVFTNKDDRAPNWDLLNDICIPEVIFINRNSETPLVYGLTAFILPRKKILTDGTLTDFEEYEMTGHTQLIGNIAQRHCVYKKSGTIDGKQFDQQGNKFLQLIKTGGKWKINAVTWEDEILN